MHSTGFWKRHKSIVFTGGILVISLLLVIIALVLEDRQFASTLLSHLGAMGVAAFVAAVFFGLHDVREAIAGSMSLLLVDGGITRHLSPDAQMRLRHKLLADSLGDRVQALPASLSEQLDRVTDHVLTLPHVYNYAATVVLADVAEQSRLITRHYRCAYTVDCRHLPEGRGRFPLRIRHELTDLAAGLDAAEVLREFEVRAGDEVFGLADASVRTGTSGATRVALVEFDRSLEVVGEARVTISMAMLCDPKDPTEIMYVWYPTKGFRATLSYRDSMAYDLAWFKSWTQVTGDFPGREELEPPPPNGITGATNEWLLPGHGVILYWFEPHEGTDPATVDDAGGEVTGEREGVDRG